MEPAAGAAALGGEPTTVLSVASGFTSWVMQDLPLALFGVSLSVVLAGFAGALAIVSFLPPFDTRQRMWSTVIICTIASSYLTKLVLHYAGLDGGFALGVGFGIGFVFQLFGTGLVQFAPRIWEAALARIKGGSS
jgi:hypothetical protein